MLSRGSEWRRWEPHIHAPGTALNNQFSGATAWSDYLTALERATPAIEAVAVTDYYVTDTYEEVQRHKTAGRLRDVKLIFPNVELRLDVATAKGGFVNLHLFVSPEDPNHVDELKRLLSRLHFPALQDRFDCTRADLIRFGRKSDPSIVNDRAALTHGANQFKVNFQTLKEVLAQSAWAKENILIAVAGGATDGTSGVRDAADQTIRREIESFAHIIFASSDAQREFWLGQRDLGPAEIRARYGGLKPCLHGSDAHRLQDVATPFGDRFSWIKGGLEFDALRQACIDPQNRAHVGKQPPQCAMPSQVISEVSIGDATWAETPSIPLNPGLVAIIGARGSGKTALAEMIAAGCDAIAPSIWDADESISPSFLARARRLLGNATTTLMLGGAAVTRSLDGRDANSHLSFPRARYLSQQFVEQLCSSQGVADGLVAEVERVIFDSHKNDDREWAIDFDDLRERETGRFQQAREREADANADISERISTEFEKESLVGLLTTQVAQKKKLITDYTTDRAKLVVKGTESQVARHTKLSDAALKLRSRIQAFTNQRRTFVALQDEVRSMRATGAPEMLRQAQARHVHSGLNASQWEDFLMVYKGDVDKSLAAYIVCADLEIAKLNGVAPAAGAPNLAQTADEAALPSLPLASITAEMSRLEALLSADKLIRDQYTALSGRIAQESTTLQTLETRLIDAQGAAARRKTLQTERDDAYRRVFEAIEGEQAALSGLYAPLMARIAASSGTLKKLGFSVRRTADVQEWGSVAEEELLDRRKSGPFQGRGALVAAATAALKSAWETGSAADTQAAMTAFVAKYLSDLLSHAPYAATQQAEFRAWSKKFALWLFGTSHISVRYEISYDGVDIRKLSPGTRGIVLLLLYLALDHSDDRPLIIDQPEENLDPKSVFDELVALFIAAKAKRQVIIVTHNANLVINTDADQIIVAEAGPHLAGGLPPISYTAGGLESASIRKAVCDTLEGGEAAFRERARRLRVRLER